jgi:uncharacterized membrane protein (UPF0127 family)
VAARRIALGPLFAVVSARAAVVARSCAPILLRATAIAIRARATAVMVGITRPGALAAGIALGAPVATAGIVLAAPLAAAGAATVPFALLAMAPTAHAAAAGPVNPPLPTRTLRIGDARLVVEVAQTSDQRTIGLMNRFSLQPDHGMLFVFDRPQPLAFWMRNTYIPLSIAFVDANGKILNIEDMQPQDESTHPSRGPALYTIEMRRGWFAGKGIQAGDKVSGLPPPAPE